MAHANDLSFGVYIYAGPIQQALINAMPGISAFNLKACVLPLALAVVSVSWRMVERPALQTRDAVRRFFESALVQGPSSAMQGEVAR